MCTARKCVVSRHAAVSDGCTAHSGGAHSQAIAELDTSGHLCAYGAKGGCCAEAISAAQL